MLKKLYMANQSEPIKTHLMDEAKKKRKEFYFSCQVPNYFQWYSWLVKSFVNIT